MIAVFLILMIIEVTGVGAFLAIYLRSDWRASVVGRHLAYYSGALFGLYVSSIASVFVRADWLRVVVLGMHVIFAAFLWQRVVIAFRAQRPPRK